MTTCYADSSALVKLVLREAESDALAAALHPGDIIVSSVMARVEVERAIRRAGILEEADVDQRIRAVLGGVGLVALDLPIAAAAAAVSPATMRSLDAIHLVTALAVSEDLDAVYCYDRSLAAAMRERGLPVTAPA